MVGIVENPNNLLDEFALVAPGQITSPSAVTVLFNSTPTGEGRLTFPHGVTPLSVPLTNVGFSPDAAGVTIETKNDDPSLTQLRDSATAAGILLALGVLAATVGLIRSEATRDVRTLSATGASVNTQRNITAATAGALGILGALCGVAVAYLITMTYFRSQLAERVGHVTVGDLVLILIAMPLMASIAGWLLAGREPADIGRHRIE